MATRIVDDPLRRIYYQRVTCVANDANGATTGRRALNVRSGYREFTVYADIAARIGLAPKIVSMFWYDDSANQWTDLLGDSRAIIDSAQTGTAQFTLAAADYLYIATVDRVGGFRLDLDASLVNNNAATMATIEYSAIGGFISTAVTDGTASGGATLAQDGNITIDAVPAAGVWAPRTLQSLLGLTDTVAANLPNATEKFHWCRLSPSALLDAVEIEQIMTLVPDGQAANTANASGGAIFIVASTVHTIDINDDYVGALEYRSDGTATTPVLDINWLKR